MFGLQSGTKLAKMVRENKSIRTYRVKGKFGEATDNCYKDGKVVERTTFQHVKQANLNKLLATMQAAHQKQMFAYVFVLSRRCSLITKILCCRLCGVDMQSQTAYELAAKGPIRPTDSKIPVIYGIKCVDLNLPEFTIGKKFRSCYNVTILFFCRDSHN